tara:strand:+ start:863 stop:2224 length:1362 start_codon:yes stop_codon:yes gene_type:complete
MATYLTRTPSAGSHGTTWTISFWFKNTCAVETQEQYLYMGGDGGTSNNMWIRLQGTSRQLYLRNRSGGSNNTVLTTNRALRDTNAWYHIVYAFDGTNATEGDRVRLYINGERQTSFSSETYPSQGTGFYIGANGDPMNIGRRNDGSGYNDVKVLFAHYHIIDGTAYNADTFGETDSTTGIWKPKLSPSVNYGTNGCFLKFENSAAMGTDSSGQTNNFTVNGTITQTIDTPTNNFNVMNSLVNIPNATFANGNTKITDGDNAHKSFYGGFAVSKGKYYWEAKAVGGTKYTIGLNNVKNSFNYQQVSNTNNIVGDASTSYLDGDAIGWYYSTLYKNGSQIATSLATIVTNDIMQCAIDLDAGKIYFGRNGTWRVANSTTFDAAQNDTTFTTGEFYVPTFSIEGASWETNFGNGYFGTTAVSSAQNPSDGIGIFEYTVPSGFKALCTKSINSQEYS